MSRNTKQTSAKVASLASDTLLNKQASTVARSLAASALSQRDGGKQTGAKMENLASKVLQSEKYSNATKELAATVLAQANKER